jgi:hypothetical protein
VRLGEIPRFEIDLIFTAAICSRPRAHSLWLNALK